MTIQIDNHNELLTAINLKRRRILKNYDHVCGYMVNGIAYLDTIYINTHLHKTLQKSKIQIKWII